MYNLSSLVGMWSSVTTRRRASLGLFCCLIKACLWNFSIEENRWSRLGSLGGYMNMKCKQFFCLEFHMPLWDTELIDSALWNEMLDVVGWYKWCGDVVGCCWVVWKCCGFLLSCYGVIMLKILKSGDWLTDFLWDETYPPPNINKVNTVWFNCISFPDWYCIYFRLLFNLYIWL